MASIGRGARTKGSNFERKIADRLSKWWGKKLRRTPNSGGLNIRCDIITENPDDMKDFPFHIECKKQEKHNVHSYYEQASSTCPPGRIPTVIFTRNRDHEFIMMRLEDFLEFTKGDIKECQIKSQNRNES